jgi:hypothetical protein
VKEKNKIKIKIPKNERRVFAFHFKFVQQTTKLSPFFLFITRSFVVGELFFPQVTFSKCPED